MAWLLALCGEKMGRFFPDDSILPEYDSGGYHSADLRVRV